MRYFVAIALQAAALITVGCSACPEMTSHDCAAPVERGPKTLFEWAACKPDSESQEAGSNKDSSHEDRGEQKADKDSRQPLTKAAHNQVASASTEDVVGDGAKSIAPGAQTVGPAKPGTTPRNGNGNNGAAEDDDEIVTDRPDFTEASTTVGRGRIQLETGYTFVRDRTNGSRLTAHSFPEALLRVGMFAEWFEARLGQNFANEQTRLPDGTIESGRGAEDLYLGVKLALTEQQQVLPEMALVLQMTVPSGARVFSAREVLPGFNWLYGWDVVPDSLSIGGSTQANRARGVMLLPVFDGLGQALEPQEGKHSFLEVAQSFTVNYSLTKQLGAYTEWFAFFPHSALDPEVGPEHYLNGGFTYKFTPNTQFDIRAGIGLNDRAEDFFAGAGFSIRY